MITHTLKFRYGAYSPCADCCQEFVDSYKQTFVVDNKHLRVCGFFADINMAHVLRMEYVTNCPFCGAEFDVVEPELLL